MTDDLSPRAREALQTIYDWRQFFDGPVEEHRRSIPAYALAELLNINEAAMRATLAELIDRELIEDVTPASASSWHVDGGAIVPIQHWPPTDAHRLPNGRSIELSRIVDPLTCADQKPTSRNVILGVKRGSEWQSTVIIGSIIPPTCRLFKLTGRGWDAIAAMESPDVSGWSSRQHRLSADAAGNVYFDNVVDQPKPTKKPGRKAMKLESDARLYKRWQDAKSRVHAPCRTIAEFAREENLPELEIHRAFMRHRQRQTPARRRDG